MSCITIRLCFSQLLLESARLLGAKTAQSVIVTADPSFIVFRFKRMPVRRRPLVLQAPLNPLEEMAKQKDHSHVHVLLLSLYVSPHCSC